MKSLRERPILFSAPMVRAILAGKKTQTRRILKEAIWNGFEGQSRVRLADEDHKGNDLKNDFDTGHISCPYGQTGDMLWVKEAFRFPKSLDIFAPREVGEKAINAGYRDPWCPARYEADDTLSSVNDWREFGSTPGEAVAGRYRHARFMPRWASRIDLEVTGVRVERLNAISEADAAAEGCVTECMRPDGSDNGTAIWNPGGFVALWESINGAGSWGANPWVWVVEFSRVKP